MCQNEQFNFSWYKTVLYTVGWILVYLSVLVIMFTSFTGIDKKRTFSGINISFKAQSLQHSIWPQFDHSPDRIPNF
jgi:hypothetical protein